MAAHNHTAKHAPSELSPISLACGNTLYRNSGCTASLSSFSPLQSWPCALIKKKSKHLEIPALEKWK